MNFGESPGQYWARIRAGGGRKPPIAFREFAQDLGMNSQKLCALIRFSDAPFPKPVLINRGAVRNSWYDKEEVRNWWRQYKTKGTA